MEDDILDKETSEIRIKQSKCRHTCFVCPQCHLYKDNLYNEQQQKIKLLEAEIARLSFLLYN